MQVDRIKRIADRILEFPPGGVVVDGDERFPDEAVAFPEARLLLDEGEAFSAVPARETRRLRAELEKLTEQLKAEAKPAKSKSKAKGKRSKSPTDSNDYDNLCDIKGVGPKMAEKLYAHGIRTLAQIAEMKTRELKELDQSLNANGKVLREHWAKQARELLGLKD